MYFGGGAVGLFASFCCLLVCGGGFVLVFWVGVLFVYLVLPGGLVLIVIWLMVAWFASWVGCWLDLVLYLLAEVFWACVTWFACVVVGGGWCLVLFLVFGLVCDFECLVGIVTCVVLDGFTVGLVCVALVGLSVCGWCCDS